MFLHNSSRRVFLKGAAALGATLMSMPLKAVARTDIRQWKVGTSVSVKDDATENPFLDIAHAGFQTVELSLNHIDKTRAAQAVAWSKEAGIALHSGHVPFGNEIDPSNLSESARQSVVDKLLADFDTYALLKVDVLNIHANAEITKPIPQRIVAFD